MSRMDEWMDAVDTDILEGMDDMGVKEQILSGEEKARLYTLAMKRIKPSKGSYRKKLIALAAAAVVLATAVTAGAAMGAGDLFAGYYGITDEAKRQLADIMSGAVEASQTSDGYTAQVKGVIGDERVINVLFDLVAPEGETLSEEYGVDGRLLIDGEMQSGGWSIVSLKDENPADNRVSFLFSGNFQGGVRKKDAQLCLENFRTFKSDGEEPLTGAQWEIPFTLDYRDSTQVIKVRKEISFEGTGLDLKDGTVLKLLLSPLSVTFEMSRSLSGIFQSNTSESQSSRSLQQEGKSGGEFGVVLTMKDGSIVDSFMSASSSGQLLRQSYSVEFSTLLDPDDIASIKLGNLDIKIE